MDGLKSTKYIGSLGLSYLWYVFSLPKFQHLLKLFWSYQVVSSCVGRVKYWNLLNVGDFIFFAPPVIPIDEHMFGMAQLHTTNIFFFYTGLFFSKITSIIKCWSFLQLLVKVKSYWVNSVKHWETAPSLVKNHLKSHWIIIASHEITIFVNYIPIKITLRPTLW